MVPRKKQKKGKKKKKCSRRILNIQIIYISRGDCSMPFSDFFVWPNLHWAFGNSPCCHFSNRPMNGILLS